MRKYLILTKANFLTGLTFRLNFALWVLGSIVYVFVIYFLWKSIFANSGKVINGMTFSQVFIYLALASSIFSMLRTGIDWEMAMEIYDGNIITHLSKPLDYQLRLIFTMLGIVASNLVTVTLPTILAIVLFFRTLLQIEGNILFFIAALFLAFLINSLIEFITGTFVFYTRSIWGISSAKEILILLFSGALIPLNFFPQALRNIIELLPFQAIYNIPLTILTSSGLTLNDYIRFLAVQAFWAMVLFATGRLLYNTAVKAVTIDGG